MTIGIQAPTNQNEFQDWWTSLKHGGLLIAPSKLGEYFVPQRLRPLSLYVEDRLRRDVTRLQNGDESQLGALLDTVLEDVLGLSGTWQKGPLVGPEWTQQAITRDAIKPRRVWQGEYGAVLPVFVADGAQGSSRASRLGIGRGKRAASRVVEWLRKADQPVALLTNGYQWRLIHAGADYDAWCEWDINFWFEEGQPGPQVTALRLLLGSTSVGRETPEATSPLVAAIQASRQGQAELSDALGERVRKAVELLIRASSTALDTMQDEPAGEPVNSRDIYIGASRIIMRCVVILFAEARDLLPRENPIYYQSYGIQGLREQLDRLSGGRASERLRNSFGAWPRLLALFRLVYAGSAHQALPVPHYGGGLFTPGDAAASDPVLRSLAALESPTNTLPDAAIYRILELLCYSRVKVRQGKRNTWVPAPVDFSDLSSEYIGILYEGLLDFELRRAAADDPMIFLNLGAQPALPLTRLEGMDDKTLASLVEKLKQKAKPSASEDEETEDDAETESENSEAEADAKADADEDSDGEQNDPDEDDSDDVAQTLRQRSYQWAVRAVEAGKLVPKPRSKKAEALESYEQQVAKMGDRLIARVILPGEWFLVRWGGTRKGSGTFYTRPQLAVPTVQRTLLPLAYDPPIGADGQPNEMAPAAQWRPKPPAEILALKVCDPACGSASFLIAALRFLVDGLWSSLFEHGWLIDKGEEIRAGIPEDAQPQWFVACVKDLPLTVERAEEYSKPRLKRYVVERCLYGVDINPLGVELGRLALWVETMDRSLAFSFLDHKIKPGNSLVGCWFDQFQDYPIMAWEREAGDATHRGVHFAQKVWTREIKRLRNKVVKEELRELLAGGVQLSMFENRLIQPPEQTHDELLATVENIHTWVLNPEQQAVDYEKSVRQKQALQELEWAFDCWCAVWFWKGNDMEVSPTPMQFVDPSPEVQAAVERVAQDYQFFHWELEFPGVFREAGSGFDAIVGNPPWEIQKPNSKEFFSNIDPLYRTYGKQEALDYQQQYFEADSNIEEDWLAYCARLKALSNWSKYVAYAFGDDEAAGSKFSLSRRKAEAELLATEWRRQRAKRTGYSDPEHPFRHQGSADINTYKMFLETGISLLKEDGKLGFILPSSVHNDLGSLALRKQWLPYLSLLVKFDNEKRIFQGLEHNSKFDVLILDFGKINSETRVAFFAWSDASALNNIEPFCISIDEDYIRKVSPTSLSIPELRSIHDKRIIASLYEKGILLLDKWQVFNEFHLTNDVKKKNISYEGIIPVYQGGMIWHQDHRYNYYNSDKKPVRGKLEDVDLRFHYPLKPKYWTTPKKYREKFQDRIINGKWHYEYFRIAFRIQSSRSNQRTFISTLIPPGCVTGNSIGTLIDLDQVESLQLVSFFCSFVHDFNVRTKVSSNINNFYVSQFAIPKIDRDSLLSQVFVRNTLRLISTSSLFEPLYEDLRLNYLGDLLEPWSFSSFALTNFERLRLRCINDALTFFLFDIPLDDAHYITSTFPGVDSKLPQELRHTILSLIAFHDLKRLGLDAFLNLNDGEGWMLPDTLRLADYGLGHDHRAQEPQPVAARLGDRFLPWQLEGTPEESWAECERHAENLRQLLGQPAPSPDGDDKAEPNIIADKHGQLSFIPPDNQQLGLFGSG